MRLKSTAVIRRRLLLLWSQSVRSRANYRCEICGKGRGDIVNEKAVKIDAHHIISKYIKDCPLKYDIRNGVSVCSGCHKFNSNSWHKNPIRTITWLSLSKHDDYEWLLANDSIRVNLNNREILAEIEARLNEGKALDLSKLI